MVDPGDDPFFLQEEVKAICDKDFMDFLDDIALDMAWDRSPILPLSPPPVLPHGGKGEEKNSKILWEGEEEDKMSEHVTMACLHEVDRHHIAVEEVSLEEVRGSYMEEWQAGGREWEPPYLGKAIPRSFSSSSAPPTASPSSTDFTPSVIPSQPVPVEATEPPLAVPREAVPKPRARSRSRKRSHTELEGGVDTSMIRCEEPDCPYTTNRSFLMNTHQRHHKDINAGSKTTRHICSHEGCGYIASDACNLRVHNRIHTGDKPFLCGIDGCQYRAAQSNNMKTHQRRSHPHGGK